MTRTISTRPAPAAPRSGYDVLKTVGGWGIRRWHTVEGGERVYDAILVSRWPKKVQALAARAELLERERLT